MVEYEQENKKGLELLGIYNKQDYEAYKQNLREMKKFVYDAKIKKAIELLESRGQDMSTARWNLLPAKKGD